MGDALAYAFIGAYVLVTAAEIAAIATAGGIIVRDSYRRYRQEREELREATRAVEGLVTIVSSAIAQEDRTP